MLKSLESRRGMDYDYGESFLPPIAKGKRNRRRNKEMPLRQNKDSKEGKKHLILMSHDFQILEIQILIKNI